MPARLVWVPPGARSPRSMGGHERPHGGRVRVRAHRYRLADQPMFIHCCHSLNCQHQTGSAFVVNPLIEIDRVEVVAGAAQPVDAPRDDGSVERIFRCRRCQVAVFSEYGRPEVRFVRAGTLDDPRHVVPDVHILFARRSSGWPCPRARRRSRPITTKSSCGQPRVSAASKRCFPPRSEPRTGRHVHRSISAALGQGARGRLREREQGH